MSYAEGTSVSVAASKAELDALLSKYGAAQRAIGSDDIEGTAQAVFRLKGRHIRLRVPLPKRGDAAFCLKPARADAKDQTPKHRPEAEAQRLWEQACRARWRALVLLTKAKLEAIELGISSAEREFLADIFLPNGRTIHEEISAQISGAYSDGKMPPLLGPGSIT